MAASCERSPPPVHAGYDQGKRLSRGNDQGDIDGVVVRRLESCHLLALGHSVSPVNPARVASGFSAEAPGGTEGMNPKRAP